MRDKKPLLNPPEWAALATIFILFVLFVTLAFLWGQKVAWIEILGRLVAALIVGLVGLAYRWLDRSESLALALIGTALFVAYTNTAVPLNYLFFPLNRELIDPLLFEIDTLLGYNWKGFVTWLVDYPTLAKTLSLVYSSSGVQLLLIIISLSFLQRHVALYRFISTGLVAGLITISFWILAPSFGPSAYLQIPQEIGDTVRLVVDNTYGAEMMRLAREGNEVMNAAEFLGVIAFPSFHTVMALMAVWYCRRTFLFYPILLLNIPMFPGILSHGGHHLIDVFGGFVVFVVTAFVVAKLIPDEPEYPRDRDSN